MLTIHLCQTKFEIFHGSEFFNSGIIFKHCFYKTRVREDPYLYRTNSREMGKYDII